MKKNILLTSIIAATFAVSAHAQMGLWLAKDTFPTNGRSAATGFSLGASAYVSCGIDSAGYKRSTFQYNPATDVWTQLQSLGGVTGSGLGRDVTMSFAIGTDAYVVGGQGSIAYMSDTWKYDGFNDTWTQVQTFTGGGRRSGVGFTINSKGYVALGQASTGLKNDIWEYNPVTNVWTQKALYPGTARRLAVAFVISNIAYVGTGDDGVCKGDFYAFDPAANSWTPKASFSGTPRYGAVGFAVNGKGYVGFGYDNTLSNRKDFYEYDPVGNNWTAMNNFPGTARSNAVAITCSNNKVYMGLGYDSLYRNDWWEFNPLLNGVENIVNESSADLYPNPMVDHATIVFSEVLSHVEKSINLYDLNGNLVRNLISNGSSVDLERGDLSAGVYIVNITSSKGICSKRLIVQ